jgi:7,8-dihydropterin-6-yl-methyl-4-(beta-D-ribofuranosyl)aminobenzene 5'-phosphate synthase
MALKLTTLCDNLSGHLNFSAAWGLSVLVESGKEVVLWDTGPSDVAAANALRNGMDLGRITCAAVSHGHVDHTGGLPDFLRLIGKEIDVYLHPDAWGAKYVQRPDKGSHMTFIGIPYRKEALEGLGAVFLEKRKPIWISDEVLITGEVPMANDFESIDGNMFVKSGDAFTHDALADDQALAVKTDKGLVVVLGCAHRGVINTLSYLREITGVEKIHAVVGGTHLMQADQRRIEQTLAALDEFGVDQIGVSHCTGMPAAMALAAHFGDRFFFNFAGKVIEF